jgi:hypothetical protein
MRVIFHDDENATQLILGREENNKVQIHVQSEIFEFTESEAQQFLIQFQRYHSEQAAINRALLPWWRRFLV